MLRAKDIMTRDVVSVNKETPIFEAVRLLMENDVTGVPVVDDEMFLVGVLSEKDVLRLYYSPEYGKEKRVEDFMTRPAIHFEENEGLDDICNCLVEHDFRRVPVTLRGKVVGIISRPDIIRCILDLAGESIQLPCRSGRGRTSKKPGK